MNPSLNEVYKFLQTAAAAPGPIAAQEVCYDFTVCFRRPRLPLKLMNRTDRKMKIVVDDLSDTKIGKFLKEHIEDMKSVSPPESKHALDLDGLRKPDVTFWSVWLDKELAGCGALKELDDSHAEIKSMRVSSEHRGKGLASNLLSHMLNEARSKGYARLSLETGSMAFFEPARRLYQSFGFEYCQPFSNYVEDPNSVFMSRELR